MPLFQVLTKQIFLIWLFVLSKYHLSLSKGDGRTEEKDDAQEKDRLYVGPLTLLSAGMIEKGGCLGYV